MEQAAERTRARRWFLCVVYGDCDETDDAARAKWEHYEAGAVERRKLANRTKSERYPPTGTDTNVRRMANPASAVNVDMGWLVGSTPVSRM
ncbi:hypothetical protein ACVXG8_13710 [Escherichia coli]